MAKIELTVKQIQNLGLWEKVCDYKGWDYYAINEGKIAEDDIVEFDDTFETNKEPINIDNFSYIFNSLYSSGITFIRKEHFTLNFEQIVEHVFKIIELSGHEPTLRFSTNREEAVISIN